MVLGVGGAGHHLQVLWPPARWPDGRAGPGRRRSRGHHHQGLSAGEIGGGRHHLGGQLLGPGEVLDGAGPHHGELLGAPGRLATIMYASAENREINEERPVDIGPVGVN